MVDTKILSFLFFWQIIFFVKGSEDTSSQSSNIIISGIDIQLDKPIHQIELNQSLQLTYFLTDVFLSDSRVSLSKEWREKTINESLNDCTILYPYPRNLFCIDHNTGSIFATSYILEYEKSERFLLKISTEEHNLTLVVQYLSIADIIVYKDYITTCDTQPRVEFMMPGEDGNEETFLSSFNFGHQRMYLTGIEYVGFKGNFNIKFVSEGAEAVLPKSTGTGVYGKYEILEQFGRLKKPIIVSKNQEFSIHLANLDGEVIRSNKTQHRLYLLPLKDYCRNLKCIEIGEKIMEAGSTNRKNIFDVITKYGFCDLSSPPKVMKTDYELLYNFNDVKTEINVIGSRYVEEAPSLEFKLVSAKPFTYPSLPRTDYPYCRAELPLYPEDNICIFKQTGLIRVAIVFESHRMNCGNGSFVVDVSSLQFPFRQITVSLNLKCVNSCDPIGERYMKMVHSGCHKDIKNLGFTEKNTLSSSGKNVSKILGFDVDIFHTSEAVGWMINVEDLKSNKTFTKNVTIGNQLSHANTTMIFLPLRTLDLKNFELSFQFTEILNNKSLGKSFEVGNIWMYYTSHMQLCMNQSCLREYMQWKKSLIGFNGDKKCLQDNYRIDRYYASCFEKVLPKFVNERPKILNDTTVQCPPYKSITRISTVFFYVLINGTTMRKVHRFPTQELEPMVSEETEYNLPAIKVDNLQSHDRVSCALFIPTAMEEEKVSLSVKEGATSGQGLYFKNWTSNTGTVMFGEPFVIPGCRFVSDLPVQDIIFLWTKNGSFFLETDYNSSSANTQMTDLTFENTSIGDAGEYRCEAKLGDNIIVQSQDSFTLNVIGIKDYTSPRIESLPVISGHPTKIIGCRFIALFRFTITASWIKNDNVIRENVTLKTLSNGTHFIHTLESFIIESASENDTGEYACRVSIQYSSGLRSVSSSSTSLVVESNAVKFKTAPSLGRYQKELLLIGCEYTSATNENLGQFGFYKQHGAGEIPIDFEAGGIPNPPKKGFVPGTSESPIRSAPVALMTFQLPSVRLKEFELGNFSCGIRIGGETFYSESVLLDPKTALLEPPVFVSNPQIQRSVSLNNTITIHGCSFRTTQPIEVEIGSFFLEIIYTRDLHAYTRRIQRPLDTVKSEEGENFYQYTFAKFDFQTLEYFGHAYRCVIQNPFEMNVNVSSNITTNGINLLLTIQTEPSTSNSSYHVGEKIRVVGPSFKFTLKKGISMFWYRNNTRYIEAEVSTRVFNRGYYYFTVEDLVEQAMNEGKTEYHVRFSYQLVEKKTASVIASVLRSTIDFITSPKLIITSSYVKLQGCQYKSTPTHDFLNQTKWFYNGQEIIKGVSVIADESDQVFKTKDIFIDSYELVGNYSCAIEVGSRTIKSKILTVTMSDFPVPVFLTHPQATYDEETGGSLLIEGCVIKSILKISPWRLVWFMNGDKISDKDTGEDDGPVFSIKTKLTNIVKEITTVRDQGFYQCAFLVDGGDAVLSTKEYVQFVDVSTTTLEILMPGEYSPAYEDKNSVEYRSKKNLIVDVLWGELMESMKISPVIRFVAFRKGSVIAVVNILFGGISKSERQQKCTTDDINYSKVVEKLGSLISSFTFDCCPSDSIGEESFKGVYKYNSTAAGETVRLPCQYSLSNFSSRSCLTDKQTGRSYWSDIDLESCPAKTELTNQLIKLSQTAVCTTFNTTNCADVVEVTKDLSNTVTNPNATLTTSQDFNFIAKILTSVVQSTDNITVDQTTVMTENIFKTLDTVVVSNRVLIAKSQLESNSSTKIVDSVEMITKEIANMVRESNETFTIQGNNTAVVVKAEVPTITTISARQSPDKNGTSDIELSVDTTEGNAPNIDSLVQVFIPAEAFGNETQVISSIFYRDDTLFQTEKELTHETNSRITSNVLKVRVGNRIVDGLDEKLVLKFKKTSLDTNGNQCVFWNFSLPTEDPKIFGGWSNKGCVVDTKSTTLSEIVCLCDHMTNFAVLLDISQNTSTSLALSVISYIGCGVSIGGLILTILTNIIFKKLRTSLPAKILICLCFSLLCLLVLFVTVVEETKPRLGCQIVASVLQYFMLSTFCWMFVEAVNLYRMFIKVFSTGSTGKFFIRANIFAWGLPLAIVIVTAASSPDSLGNDNFCVVVGYPFYFGVAFPVIFILLVNTGVLFLVMHSLRRNRTMSSALSLPQQTRVALAVSTLLGITWIFGLLAVGDLREVFQYLFTIFNSIQGLLIFIFYTFLNPDARKCWYELFGIDPHSDINKYSTSDSTGRSSAKSTVASSEVTNNNSTLAAIRDREKRLLSIHTNKSYLPEDSLDTTKDKAVF